MFESLLGFVAQLSVVLWALVLFTLIFRFIGIFMYRRGGARSALVRAVVPNETLPATATTASFDEIRQPAGASAAVAVSARMPRHAPEFATSSSGW
ncbi:hypothetical protein [Kocuria rosea]|nr:hypothetical protein [Kocuria polaris]